MNPKDLFWLTEYAFNTLNPLVKAGEKLIIQIEFDGTGINAWIHSTSCSHVRAFQTGLTKWQDVEAFAATLKPLETVIAA